MFSVLFTIYLGWMIGFLAAVVWWVGLLQQKEYRLDRVKAHFHSLTGRQILLHILPSVGLLHPKTFKRPVRTLRVKLLFASALLILFLIAYLLLPWVGAVPSLFIARLVLLPVLLYVFAPVVLLSLTTLMNVAVWGITTYYLHRVEKLILARKPFVIGITGSFGKTTTKQLLAHVLAQRGSVCTTPGSVNTALGVSRNLLNNLGRAETLVLEYAAYCPGEIARLAAAIPPDMVILTGLGKQHIELFGSQQNIALAKAELLEALPEGSRVFCANESALAIVSAAKNRATLLVEETWLSTKPKATTTIIGEQFTNTLKVVSVVAKHLGVSQKQITSSLESFVPTEKWIRRRTLRSGAVVIDDSGTSNPDGFSAAVKILAQEKAQRKILLTAGIVDLGKESISIHRMLATQATDCVSEVWYLGEVGREVFATVFAKNLFAGETEISQRLQTLDEKTAILIEGRIPRWLEAAL
ncbi:MAG: Mur ligase family protein [bacterium]|nr:Mur ligase family protein [bacterium]